MEGITPTGLIRARAKLMLAINTDVTWSDMADALGVTPQSLSRIRTGQSGGSASLALKISQMLSAAGAGISIEELMQDHENGN